jgi:hypothetical protein
LYCWNLSSASGTFRLTSVEMERSLPKNDAAKDCPASASPMDSDALASTDCPSIPSP